MSIFPPPPPRNTDRPIGLHRPAGPSSAGFRGCRRGFTLIEMLVVIAIVMILMTLIIATVVSALGEMQAAGGASGLSGFLRDAQVHAVQSGKVLAVRADEELPPGGSPFWRLTAWEFPTNADALLRSQRGLSSNPNDWPQGTLPAAEFDLDPRQNLQISVDAVTLTVANDLTLPAILLMPDGTANRDVNFAVVDRAQAKEGDAEETIVQLQHSTGRVYLYSTRFDTHP